MKKRNTNISILTGGHGNLPRVEDDFYPTPEVATRALLRNTYFTGPVWEPACGDGAITKVLRRAGFLVHSSDIVKRKGITLKQNDFLTSSWTPPEFNSIITNPPYSLAIPFARVAIDHGVDVAFFLKSAILSGHKAWSQLFKEKPPSLVLSLERPVPYRRDGVWVRGSFGHVWVVWRRNPTRFRETTIRWVGLDE